MSSSPGKTIRDQWQRLHRWPGGRKLFSRFIGAFVPYTGTVRPQVLELKPGYARVSIRDRAKVRNHLRSVHAIALANLAELTGNLAMVSTLPDDARFIVKKLSIMYLKKARGRITGICECRPVQNSERQEIQLEVDLFDDKGDKVARAEVETLVGPIP